MTGVVRSTSSDSSEPALMNNARLYALSHFGKALLWVASDTFTLFYLTDICRFPAADVGWFFLLVLLWSAMCDLVAGWLCDRLAPSPRKLRSVIRLGAMIASIAFAATFAVPVGGSRWIWLALASCSFRAAYSLFDVPHNALLPRLVEAGGGAIWLSSARLGLNMIATLAVTAASPWLLVSDLSSARSTFCISAAALALFAGGAVVVGTPLLAAPSAREVPRSSVKIMPIGIMFAVATVGALLVSLLFKAVFYFASYTLGHPDWASRALVLATCGKLFGATIWGAFARGSFGAVRVNRIACLATLVTSMLLMATLDHVWMIEIGIVLLGSSLAGTVIAPWAALADQAAHRSTSKTVWFGGFTALSKIGIGVSGWFLALLLAKLDIVSGQPVDAHQGRTLFVACVMILALGAGLCLALLSFSVHAASTR